MGLRILTLIGGLILLGSWVVQSTLYDYWDKRQSSLERAESIYISCLSSTFTMDAIQTIAPKGKNPRFWNNENFRLGLGYMATGLSTDQRQHWREMIQQAADDKLNDVGLKLMKEVTSEQQFIEHWRSKSRWLFVISYVVASFVVAASEALKPLREDRR